MAECTHEWIWASDYQECRRCGVSRPQGATIVELRDALRDVADALAPPISLDAHTHEWARNRIRHALSGGAQ